MKSIIDYAEYSNGGMADLVAEYSVADNLSDSKLLEVKNKLNKYLAEGLESLIDVDLGTVIVRICGVDEVVNLLDCLNKKGEYYGTC